MTLLSGGAVCDDDEIKYGEAGDEPTAPPKRLCPPWTAEEDAILLQVRKQYDAGEFTSYAAFGQAASDALGGKRTPSACYFRYSKLRPEPQPGIARPKRIKLDANAAMDCDDADGDEGGAAAVLHKSKAPDWSPDEHSVLRRLVDRWGAKQFASAESFYVEAVQQLAGRKAGAIQKRLRILDLTVPSDGKGGGGPFWSQSENDILMDIYCQCNTGQFDSGEQLSEHLAERLPGRSAIACYNQLRKLGHDVPQVLRQILNASDRTARAAAKRDEHGAAVALEIKPPLWSPEEDSVLKHMMSHWRAKQFASGHEFYVVAVKRLPGRSAIAIEYRLRRLKTTNPPSAWDYKPANQRAAPTQPPAHAAAAADVAAAVKDDISDDAPLPAQPQSTLPPPPLWMIRHSATGKTWGPFLISVLRRGVAEGRISAKEMLAWRQHEGESAAMSLQAALDLPRIPSRSQQTKRMRTR
jgi:Myb-like DNA-binding domain